MQGPLLQFKITHRHLQLILRQDPPDKQELVKMVNRYIGLMVEDTNTDMFDHFCEEGGVSILSQLLSVSPLIAVKSYALLLINLKHPLWVSFILCQPFITKCISLNHPQSQEEEWTEHFVSFLKSLSIRLQPDQIPLFYNKKHCNFPLAEQTAKLFFHPDFMVRTSAMNVALTLSNIKHPLVQTYFSRFPYTSYLLTFTCQIYELIERTDTLIRAEQWGQLKQKLNGYQSDLPDYLQLVNDFMQGGAPQTISVLQHCFIAYVVQPVLFKLMSGNVYQVRHALIIINSILAIVTSPAIINSITSVILKKNYNPGFAEKLNSWQQVYLPPIIEAHYDSQHCYWDKYKSSLTRHYLQVFTALQNFNVDSESVGLSAQEQDQFKAEVSKMSEFIRYDLLEQQQIGASKQENQMKLDQVQENILSSKMLTVIENSNQQQIRLIIQLFINKNLTITTSNNSQQTEYLEDIDYTKRVQALILTKLKEIDWMRIKVEALSSMLLFLQQPAAQTHTKSYIELFLINLKALLRELNHQIKSCYSALVVDNFQPIISSPDKQKPLSYSSFLLPSQLKEHKLLQMESVAESVWLLKCVLQRFRLAYRFLCNYYSKYYQKQLPKYSKQHEIFMQTGSGKWKIGQEAVISNRETIECRIGQSKTLSVLVEDALNLLLGSTDPSYQGKVLILQNSPWHRVEIKLSRADGRVIALTTPSRRHLLTFKDQATSNNTYLDMLDHKRQRYDAQFNFIQHYLATVQEELQQLTQQS